MHGACAQPACVPQIATHTALHGPHPHPPAQDELQAAKDRAIEEQARQGKMPGAMLMKARGRAGLGAGQP